MNNNYTAKDFINDLHSTKPTQFGFLHWEDINYWDTDLFDILIKKEIITDISPRKSFWCNDCGKFCNGKPKKKCLSNGDEYWAIDCTLLGELRISIEDIQEWIIDKFEFAKLIRKSFRISKMPVNKDNYQLFLIGEYQFQGNIFDLYFLPDNSFLHDVYTGIDMKNIIIIISEPPITIRKIITKPIIAFDRIAVIDKENINIDFNLFENFIKQIFKLPVIPAQTTSNPISVQKKFCYSNNFQSISFNKEPYTLNKRQAIIVKTLYEAYQNNTPEVSTQTLSDLLEPNDKANSIPDIFKNHPAWNILIVSGKQKGSYRLNLD
jgi:hypothetical protein